MAHPLSDWHSHSEDGGHREQFRTMDLSVIGEVLP